MLEIENLLLAVLRSIYPPTHIHLSKPLKYNHLLQPTGTIYKWQGTTRTPAKLSPIPNCMPTHNIASWTAVGGGRAALTA